MATPERQDVTKMIACILEQKRRLVGELTIDFVYVGGYIYSILQHFHKY